MLKRLRRWLKFRRMKKLRFIIDMEYDPKDYPPNKPGPDHYVTVPGTVLDFRTLTPPKGGFDDD